VIPPRFIRALVVAGVEANGPHPWDIQIYDADVFARVRLDGLTGLGDAYVDGLWDCESLDQFFARALGADLGRGLWLSRDVLLTYLIERVSNLQTMARSRRNVERHYNLGNDLFKAMLDPLMVYSCGYWRHADDLAVAQLAKLDLVCRKVGMRPGMRVLDIGCGWGGLAKFAAERYGVSVVGITLSQEQLAYGREACRGLPVDLRLCDYRAVSETFDRAVSIGMFEHVGPKNYGSYMRAVERCLTPDGLALLHFFASRESFPNTSSSEVNWITKHIFPGMVVPSLKQVGAAIDGLFVLEDLHNFGADYDPTLMAWHENFDRAWPSLKGVYGDRFYRMWKYYLLMAAGAFRARKYQLWQLVLSRRGVPDGYQTVR